MHKPEHGASNVVAAAKDGVSILAAAVTVNKRQTSSHYV
jgi:hypothetical protein